MKIRKARKEEIKAIVFDIGNVLITEDNPKVILDLENKFKLARRKYLNKSLVRNNSFWFERKVAKKLNIDKNLFVNYWYKLINKNHFLNKEVVNIIKVLRKNKYFLATLTDVNYSYEKIREKFNIYSLFDIKIKSIDLKTIKSKKKIYRILLNRLKVDPREIIFIDDFKINLELAREFGIKTILFKNSKQLKKDLIELGVKFQPRRKKL